MTAIDFLRSKGMLADDATTFVIIGTFGQVDLTSILDEYAAQAKAIKTVETVNVKGKGASKKR